MQSFHPMIPLSHTVESTQIRQASIIGEHKSLLNSSLLLDTLMYTESSIQEIPFLMYVEDAFKALAYPQEDVIALTVTFAGEPILLTHGKDS